MKFFLLDIAFDQSQVGFCNCSLTPKTDVYGPNIVTIKQINHKCCDDLIGNRYVRKELQEKLNENLIPQHLVHIYNKFVDQTKEKGESIQVLNDDDNDDNLIKNKDSNIFEELNNQNKSENKNNNDENQIDVGTSKSSSSSISSSSSDSSLSSTSTDSNKSLLSSSSITSSDSDDDSDLEPIDQHEQETQK